MTSDSGAGRVHPGAHTPPPAQVPPQISKFHRKQWIVLIVSILILVAAGIAFFFTQSLRPQGTILATVNGVPIYYEDIDATLAFLPDSYRTPEQRQSLLNQTIDMRLLTQEAQRRGIEVQESTVDARIESILEDTGNSPPELRLILAGKNLTVQQFRSLISDQLLVESLGQQAVLSRVSVLEEEISTSYTERRAEFVPPENGARISHILVENESTAREVIAALNRGESFRALAATYSLDSESKIIGGAIGIILPSDSIDETFRNAALGLRENQYTKQPIKTGAGYHVILRNPDISSIEEVRDIIQTSLLRRKQASAFAAFLEGLRLGAEVKIYTASGVVTVPRRAPDSMEAFAACVGTKATLYTMPRNDAVERQLALFGSATPLLTIVDCETESTRCIADNIRKFPAWAIENDIEGESSLVQLSELTSCALPLMIASN